MDNCTSPSNLESHFDKTVTLIQSGKEIEYGIIDGNNYKAYRIAKEGVHHGRKNEQKKH